MDLGEIELEYGLDSAGSRWGPAEGYCEHVTKLRLHNRREISPVSMLILASQTVHRSVKFFNWLLCWIPYWKNTASSTVPSTTPEGKSAQRTCVTSYWQADVSKYFRTLKRNMFSPSPPLLLMDQAQFYSCFINHLLNRLYLTVPTPFICKEMEQMVVSHCPFC